MLFSCAALVNPNLIDQRRQDFAGFAEKRIMGEPSQRRRIFVDFNDSRAVFFCAAPQIGRGIHEAGSSNRQKYMALFHCSGCCLERSYRQRFAEPNDVWPQISAARSTSTFFDIEVAPRAFIFETTKTVNVSV